MNKNNNFLGGAFDFNGDGKTDLKEQFAAYNLFKKYTETNDADNDSSDAEKDV